MSAQRGLDLSGFKKISSDEKTTLLRHPKGHEIKVAHSALDSKMKESLNALPMAEGGKVKLYADPEEPVAADDNAPTANTQPMDPTSPAQTDDGSDPIDKIRQSALDYNPEDKSNKSPLLVNIDNPHFVDDTQSEEGPSEGEDKKPVPSTPSLPQLNADDMNWLQDQRNGHITPQTYQGLFAKQDTLGKIGTLFGLLVSGAGSGLAHQPNAVLAMMDKQIQNDLEAQKQSKANVQNYYNTALHLMTGIPNAEKAAAEAAISKMRVSYWQHLTHTNDKAPPGPIQQTGSALLQALFPQIQAANAQNNAKSILAMHQNTGGQDTFEGPVNKNFLSTLPTLDPERAPLAAKEAENVFNTRSQWESYLDSNKKLNTLTAGESGETLGAADKLLQGLAAFGPEGALVEQMAGASGPGAALASKFQQERNALIAKLGPDFPPQFLPSLYDFNNANTRAEKMRGAAEWAKRKEGLNINLNALQSAGFNVITPQPYDEYIKPKPSGKPQGKKAAPKEEEKSSGQYQGLVDALQKKNQKMAK